MHMRSVVLVGLVAVAGCAGPRVDRSPSMHVPDATVVLFFVDGLSLPVVRRLAEAGRVPNIRRVFLDGGVGVDHAVTSLPSITYPNAVSLITGRYPGRHGVLGNQWFDRTTAELPGYIHADSYRSVNGHFDDPTLYDVLHDDLTVNVQGHTRRGVTQTIDNWPKTAVDWFLHRFTRVDHRVGRCADRVARLAAYEGRWPIVQTYYFPGVDETGHRVGPDAAAYAAAIDIADGAVGRIVDRVLASPAGDRTTFILVSDHGMVGTPPDRAWGLIEWMRDTAGLRVHTQRLTSPWAAWRRRRLAAADAVVILGADRRAHVHLPGPRGWPDLASVDDVLDLAARLLEQAAIDTVAIPREVGTVDVLRRSGQARVQRRRSTDGVSEYRIDVVDGTPTTDFEWPDGLLGTWLGARDWLEATAATPRPDFTVQISHLFDSHRAGDLVVFAADDWSLATDWPGGHGSCVARDMRIPMFFSGPGLEPGGRVSCARLVDIMPTILELVGAGDRLAELDLDGVSIASQLREASAHDR